MKIGFDFRMGGSINAGIGRYVFELLRHVLDRDTENEYVIFFHPQNSSPEDLKVLESYSNVTLVSIRARHYSATEQVKFLYVLNKHNLDLVHFPNFNVPVMYKRPFVVTIHDMVHHKISGHKKSRLIYFYGYKYVINKAAQNAKKIITVTDYAKKEIVHYLNVPEEKITVVYEAPFLQEQSESTVEEVKKKYILNKPYFLFVGTLERKKNLISLTRGFNTFIENTKLDMDLVIAGKADKHYPDIKYKAMDIKHRDRLVFTDFVSDTDLAALYQGAFAFATASLHEGFGLPGVEAMQFGLPVLASNTEVFNEVYDNAAIYFDAQDTKDIADKMALVAKDPQFYAQQQQKSLARYQLFDWDKAAEQTLEVYRQVLSGVETEPAQPEFESDESEPEDE